MGPLDQLRVVLTANKLFVHVATTRIERSGAPVLLQLLKLLCCSPGGRQIATSYSMRETTACASQWAVAKGRPTTRLVVAATDRPLDLFYPYWSVLW